MLGHPHSACLARACNSLAKWAAGISDTLSLGLLVEAVGKRQPVLAMPVQ
jgi:flavoprotein